MTAVKARAGGVLLIGFGGPAAAGEIRPFLDRVLQGRPVPRERYEEVVHHYEILGGRSPYNEHTMRQAEALRARLKARGADLPVAVGMRNSEPFIEAALRELAERGVSHAMGFILSAYRCEASYDRYQENVAAARVLAGPTAPTVEYPGCWHDHPLFIAAVADRIRDAAVRHEVNLNSLELVFTAHSIPLAMSARAPYLAQLNESARLVAAELGAEHWSLAFQSRSGNPREPWLEPDIGTTLRTLRGRTVIVQPIGFLCDHIEVLYDLDVEAAEIARESGVTMIRAGTVGDHPKFIEMIASIVGACAARD
jgi:protoporphyrin/coproporphyrin ferrochelatase